VTKTKRLNVIGKDKQNRKNVFSIFDRFFLISRRSRLCKNSEAIRIFEMLLLVKIYFI